MSEQVRPSPPIYVPRSSAKEIHFDSGRSMLKLSFRSEDLLAFVKLHTNAKGYINLNVSKRREVGQYGDTHSIVLDTWQPGQQRSAPSSAATPPPTQEGQSGIPEATAANKDDSDVPF